MRICLYGIFAYTADGCVIDHYTSYPLVINFSLTKQVGGRDGGRRKECLRAHYFFSLTRHPPLNFSSTPLALSSATFHSRLKTELFKLSYPDSAHAPRHIRHHHRLQP